MSTPLCAIQVASGPHNNRMKLTKRPRGATGCQTGGATCAFAHRAFRSLSPVFDGPETEGPSFDGQG
jgi:hypothetical protein